MKKFFFTALVGAMMISCSRDNDNTNPTTPQTPATNEIGILPTKLTFSQTGKADKVTTFSYNGNKLIKATHDNKDVIYTYTGDLITSMNNPNESSYVFNYDSNGNLISEKTKFYNGTIKISENDITYTVNGSTVTAQKISKNYDDITGTLSSITTSTITYTLDAKKRPIKEVEVSEKKYATGNIAQKDNNISTYEYANHHSFLKNIKGMDKLYYSSLTIKKEKINGLVFPFSYTRGELITYLYDQPIGHYPSVEGYTYQTKAAYTLNTNGYPTKIAYKTRDTITLGLYEDNGYYTIEYNK